MKKVLFIAFILMGFISQAQNWNNIYGRWEYPWLRIDSALFIPSGNGAPSGTISLRGAKYKRQAAFYSDTAAKKLYMFNPKDSTWTDITGGGGGGVSSVTGTTNRVTITNPTTTPVVDISSAYVGQPTISILGTIGTGVWNGTAIGPTYGGLGFTSVTTGDLPYGSATNTWAKLPGVATGNALISGGVGTAFAWGKIGLTTHVSGILPVANGGTGTATPGIVAGTNTTVTGTWPNQTINSTGSNKRSGVNPGGYPSASIIVDTAGKVICAMGTRNDLVSYHGVSDTIAIGGMGAHFNQNKSQALTIASNPTLQGGATSLTFAAWVKLDTIGVLPQTVLSKDDNRTKKGSEYLISFYPPYSGWVMQVEEPGHTLPNDGTTWPVISSTGVPIANQWYFIVGQYDIAGKVKIWVNGVLDSAVAVAGGTNVTNTPFALGAVVDDFDSTGLPECCSFLNGTLRNVGMWKRLLTPAEILYLYNNTAVQFPPPGLNPGTMINGPTFASSVPTPLSSYVYSVDYDGTNDKTGMSSGITMAAGTSSVSLWFNADALGGMVLGNSGNANAYIRVLNSTTIRVQTNVGSTFQDFTVGTMNTGTWYNIIVVRSASNLTRVYVNGTQSSSGGLSQTDPIGIDEVGLYWDGSVGGLNWNGRISDVRFYNSILSGGDIAALQTNSATSATPYLWYRLNEGAGTTNIDYGTAATPHPINYYELTNAMRFEKPNTFISYWDLDEPYDTRKDARLRNVIRDSGVTNMWSDLTKQCQTIYGSTVATGDLIFKATTHTAPVTGATIKMLANAADYRAITIFNSGKVSIGDSIENDNLSILAPTTSNIVNIALRRNDGLLLAGLSSDASAQSLLQANGPLEIRTGTNGPINLNPANQGVTVGPVFSTPNRFQVLENRTGLTDTIAAGVFDLSGSTFNTTGDSAMGVAVIAHANGTRSAGSNNLPMIGIYAKAENGQINWAGYFDGKIVVRTMDSTTVPVNMLYQDVNGEIKKAAVPSGGTGSYYSLNKQYTDVNNVGTSSTDIYTYTIAANKLSTNGNMITFETSGTLNDATATVNLQALFAGNGIAGAGLLAISGTGNWNVKGYVIRTGTTTARTYAVISIDNSTNKIYSTTALLTGLDFTTTNIIKVTGTAGGAGGGSNDITGQTWMVDFKQ